MSTTLEDVWAEMAYEDYARDEYETQLISQAIEDLSKEEAPLVPTDDEIEELSQSQARIKALNESLAARGLTITITPGKKGSLQVEVDGEKLEDGRLKATGAESVSVTAADLGKVAVKAAPRSELVATAWMKAPKLSPLNRV